MLIISIQTCPNSLWHGMALNLPFIVQLHTSSQMKAASLSGRLIDAFFALSERNVVLSVPKNSLLFEAFFRNVFPGASVQKIRPVSEFYDMRTASN